MNRQNVLILKGDGNPHGTAYVYWNSECDSIRVNEGMCLQCRDQLRCAIPKGFRYNKKPVNWEHESLSDWFKGNIPNRY